MKNPEVVWNAPDGVMGLSFDDGPQPVSSEPGFRALRVITDGGTHTTLGVRCSLLFPATEQRACDPFLHRREHFELP